MNTLTEAQEMWMDAIISVVNQLKFNIKIGDMSYVMGNMIGLSSDYSLSGNDLIVYI